MVLVIGILGSRHYVIHVSRGHMDLDSTENEIRHCHQVFGPISAVLIEDAAAGPAVISHLKENIAGVISVTPAGGKMSRLMVATPEFMANDWFFERGGAWTSKFVEELTLFPNARNDDLADALSQAAIWLQTNTRELGWIDWIKTHGQAYLDGIFGGEKTPKPAPARPQLPIASSKPQEETYPFCKKCNVMLWVFGSTPATGNLRCYQCGGVFLRDGTPIAEPQGPCSCITPLIVVIAGARRCQQCGWQSNEPQAVGMSRAAAYQSTRGLGRFR